MAILSIIFMDIYIGLDGFEWYEELLFSGITYALIQYTRTPMKFKLQKLGCAGVYGTPELENLGDWWIDKMHNATHTSVYIL